MNIPDTLKKLINQLMRRGGFEGSARYWENRYKNGGNSGQGSYNELATFKASFLNRFVEDEKIDSVIEWGCGDGKQLGLSKYPVYYGLDVSRTAIEKCTRQFTDRQNYHFEVISRKSLSRKASLALSIDVIYHLVEDDVFTKHMRQLFQSARTYVIIYSCDFTGEGYPSHIKPRKFSQYIADHFRDWSLVSVKKNPYPVLLYGEDSGSWSDFFIYRKNL
jgi:hypothetical protein